MVRNWMHKLAFAQREGELVMTQNSSSPAANKPFYTVIGLVIGALIALAFAKAGNPGLIGVGAVVGLLLSQSLNRRFKEND